MFFEKNIYFIQYYLVRKSKYIIFYKIPKNVLTKPFDILKNTYIIPIMVVITTAGGSDEQSAREGNDGRVD